MDAIVEVDMQGKVVWEWWFFDHVVQDVDPAKPNHVGAGKTIADHPGRINLNLPGRPLKRDWLHCNSMDYNAESGHIVINSVQGELYVIDHDGTFVAGDPKAGIAKAAGAGGRFPLSVRRPGPLRAGRPAAGAGKLGLGDLRPQADGRRARRALDPRPACPARGTSWSSTTASISISARRSRRSWKSIRSSTRAGRDTGKYVNPPDAGYRRETYDKDTHNQPRQISNQIVWSYRSVNSHGFFSHIGSSGQRLPNGNTFICSDTEGHFFEVTAKGELAWEYINPVTRDGPVKVLGDVLPMTNSAFRAYRYAADHPAFKGRDLTPKGTITERAAQGHRRLSEAHVRPATARPAAATGKAAAGKAGQGWQRCKTRRRQDNPSRASDMPYIGTSNLPHEQSRLAP